MDKTRSVGKKWLANELDPHFLALKKCIKGQSNRSILSKVIVLTNYWSTDRHTDKQTDGQRHSRKPFHWVQRVSKRGYLTKTGGGGVPILHKSNIFSDETVKNVFTCINLVLALGSRDEINDQIFIKHLVADEGPLQWFILDL